MASNDIENSISKLWTAVAISTGFNQKNKKYITTEKLRKFCSSAKLLERTLIILKLKGLGINSINESKLKQVENFTCH
jgi:hypothetical protein